MTREELIEAASALHDATGCSCDRRYLMSCPGMAKAVLEAGRVIREREASRDMSITASTVPMGILRSCSLCGDEGCPGLNLPVTRPDGAVALRRLCQHCLSSLLGVALQLAGHAHERIAAEVIAVQDTGHILS